MDIKEFILLDKHKVRRDSNLMHLYLEFFKTAFNRVPNCAGCSFGSDWQKLINFHTGNKEKSVTLQKQKVMNKISIKKIQGKILAYKKDGRTYRMYDNILTDSFIKEYISNGSEEEIAERKKMFLFPAVSDPETDAFEKALESENVKEEDLDYVNDKISQAKNQFPVTPKKRGRKSKK